MRPVLRFADAFIRHSVAFVMGCLVVAWLWYMEIRNPAWLFAFVIGTGLLVSAFRTWQEQRLMVESIRRDLEAVIVAFDSSAAEVSDEELWLLAVVYAYGLRLEPHAARAASEMSPCTGQTFVESRWFLEVHSSLCQRSLLDKQGDTYAISRDGERALGAALRKGRVPTMFPLTPNVTGKNDFEIPAPFADPPVGPGPPLR